MAPIKVEKSDKEKQEENKNPAPKKEAWVDISKKSPKTLEDKLEDALNSTKPASSYALAIAWKAHTFTENMTMHGIRYVFARDVGKLRRFLKIFLSSFQMFLKI